MRVTYFLLAFMWLYLHWLSPALSAGPGNPITRIAEINNLKARAQALAAGGSYQEAAAVYASLLEEYELQEDELWLNRAHMLYLAAKLPEAQEAYRNTTVFAKAPAVRSQAYNQLGNLAVQLSDEAGSGQREALSLFTEALRADWENTAARRNFEIVYRRLNPKNPPQKPTDDQQPPPNEQEQEPEEPIEPSAYAQAQKARADALIAEGNYGAAYTTMAEALERDPTVQAYNDYINRLGDIAQIAE